MVTFFFFFFSSETTKQNLRVQYEDKKHFAWSLFWEANICHQICVGSINSGQVWRRNRHKNRTKKKPLFSLFQRPKVTTPYVWTKQSWLRGLKCLMMFPLVSWGGAERREAACWNQNIVCLLESPQLEKFYIKVHLLIVLIKSIPDTLNWEAVTEDNCLCSGIHWWKYFFSSLNLL